MLFYKIYPLLILVIFISCTNPFSVRDAEPPDILNDSYTYERPTLSETVLINLRYAMTEKNRTNYKKCFIDANSSSNFTFKFLHDQRIEGSFFNDWSLNDEIQYFSDLSNSDTLKTIKITFSDTLSHRQISNHPDSVWTSFNYDLLITFDKSMEIYKGQSIIKLVKDANSLWTIYYWEDRPNSDNYLNTWSVLKQKWH